jgi:hypothetical protein
MKRPEDLAHRPPVHARRCWLRQLQLGGSSPVVAPIFAGAMFEWILPMLPVNTPRHRALALD